MFTQKHYVAIADLIHARRKEVKATQPADSRNVVATESRLEEIATLTLALTKLFKGDNPKFKEFTFIEACNRDLKE